MVVSGLLTTLPVVATLQDCADWSKTVVPYLPQLYTLPQQVLANLGDFNALKTIYLSTNPLISALAFATYILAPGVLIASEIERNYSEVDRLWSLLPVFYNCHYALWAHLHGLPTKRLDHVMAVSILWGARLTFNYARKGGYSLGSEDYRWARVKKYLGPFWMFLFNVTFISLIQSILLWLITTPSYVLLLTARIPAQFNVDTLTIYDQIFPKLMFVFILLEFFADQQQWNFHAAKSLYSKTARVPTQYPYTRAQLDHGFNTAGLWAWSRHPNFLGEQAFWITLYQWGCCESNSYLNWTFSAAFAYLCLFQASTWLTEMITSEKYPEYQVYIERVGKFLPKLKTHSMEEPRSKKEEEKVLKAQEAKNKGDDQILSALNNAKEKAKNIGKGKGKGATARK